MMTMYVSTVLLVAAAFAGFALPAAGQEPAAPSAAPLVLVGAEYHTPTRWSGTAAVLIATPRTLRSTHPPDSTRSGVLVAGGAGVGGVRAGAGLAALAHDDRISPPASTRSSR